jgi:hypothetical protein
MIKWICSYPRSGSAWTRQTLEQLFEQPVCLAEPKSGYERYVRMLSQHLGFKQVEEDEIAGGLVSATGRLVWVLKDGFPVIRDASLRKRIASDRREFYIKSHAPTFASYDKNESVFFMVRHPMAVFVSYKRFLKERRDLEISLEELITKRDGGRMDYIEYTERFLALCLSDERHLIQRYEDKRTDYDGAVRKLERFVGRQALSAREMPPSEYPIYDPVLRRISQSKMTGWLESVPPETLKLFKERFAPLLSRLGYRMPNETDYAALDAGRDIALTLPSNQLEKP